MRQGFTLLELSIVLVIIGLIIGGVTVGQDLIRSSELQNVTKEHSALHSALNTFKLKYSSIPGDMDNATAYWGVAHATPATCRITASTGTETCDGDGDGIIDSSTGSLEWFRFWQHLANAELIPGSYTGIYGNAAQDSADTSNSLTSKSGAGGLWFVANYGTWPGNALWFATTYDNMFILGGAAADSEPRTAYFSPVELAMVDEKMDDGEPGTGKIIAGLWDTCTDAANNADLTSSYLLSDDTKQCVAIFVKQF